MESDVVLDIGTISKILIIMIILAVLIYFTIPQKEKINVGLLIFVLIFTTIIIDTATTDRSEKSKTKKIIEETSADGRYKVIISIIESTGLTGYSDLVLSVGLKQDEDYIIKEYLRCHVHCWTNEEYFNFEWLNDGVKIIFLGCEKGELKYRIYWEDVF